MADNLFPDGYEDEVITEEENEAEDESPVGYQGGIFFDYEAGDFPLDGKSCIRNADGIDSWKMWCQNCIMTERYKYIAYDTDFGIELDAAFQAETREKAESLLTRQIVEALEADPYGRTEYVSNITFDWTAPDSVQIGCTIKGIDDVTIDISANITR